MPDSPIPEHHEAVLTVNINIHVTDKGTIIIAQENEDGEETLVDAFSINTLIKNSSKEFASEIMDRCFTNTT